MTQKKRKGFFISFEGIDGCGKSTQSDLLYKHLLALGSKVLKTREPGGTRVSDKLRAILLDSELTEITERTEVLLYIASRAQLVEQVIRPAMLEDQIVICDRFFDSTTAYQGYGRKLGAEQIGKINSWATMGFEPDITIILDVDITESMRRMANKGADRMESEGADFFSAVRDGYLKIAISEPDRALLIDGSRSIAEVHEEIKQTVDEKLSSYKKLRSNENDPSRKGLNESF